MKENNEIDKKTLRIFGIALSIAILFWSMVYLFFSQSKINSIWPMTLIFTVIFLLSIAYPRSLLFIYKPWMKMAHFLNQAIVSFLLTLIYLIVVTPIALLKRSLGKDEMIMKDQCLTDSFRKKSQRIIASDLENPF